KQNAPVGLESERAQRGVKRGKEPARSGHAGFCEGVKQSGLAGVGVSDQSHGRKLLRTPVLTLESAPRANTLDGLFQPPDASADAPAVKLELLLAGPACADAAAQPGEECATARQAGQEVIHLRQF